jgi:hypothetical protein
LIWVSKQTTNWNRQHFLQTANIDLQGCEFTPIGNNTSSHFKGTYDGGGYTIEGLYIRETDWAGLFGDVNETATFKNIGLVGVDILSSSDTRGAGALAGRVNGGNIRVTNSYSTGTVTGKDVVGGLIGEINSGGTSTPTIANSYSSAAVTSTLNNGRAGGLVGVVRNSGAISNSYSRGPVTMQSPATSSNIGAFVGLGGSLSVAPTVSDSFYDSDVSALSNGVGTGKTTTQMKEKATFTNWAIVSGWEAFDFSNPNKYWGICEGSDYPFLLSQFSSYSCPVAESGSNDSSALSAGVPGIFLYVAGPVGRSVAHSPVYYGTDRVAAASEYEVRVLSSSSVNSGAITLASGTLPANGSIPATMVRLPHLEPGTYLVRITGKHTTGKTLQLTAQITVGPAGTFTSIGPNIPVIR